MLTLAEQIMTKSPVSRKAATHAIFYHADMRSENRTKCWGPPARFHLM